MLPFFKQGLISDKYAGYCAELLVGRTLSGAVGTVVSFAFTSVVLIRVDPMIALFMIGGNLFGIFKTWLEARINYYVIVDQMKERRLAEAYQAPLFDRKAIKEVKIFGLTNYLYRKWYQYTNHANRKTTGYNLLFLLLDTVMYSVSRLFSVIALILTAKLILVGEVSIGTFLLIYSSSGSLIDTSGSLFQSMRDLKLAEYYAKAFQSFMEMEDVEPTNVLQSAVDQETETFDIVFDHVSFAYEGSGQNAIDDLNLRIREGEKLAIVGENGSGKSTLVALLNRLYAPDSGQIYVAGMPQAKAMPLLRRSVSVVFQDFGRYETTIRDNIAMGDPQKEHSASELCACAARAGATALTDGTEYRLDTPIGRYAENGVELSGGQWQKLAIARGILNENARMIILDEPNAALDPIAEAELYERVLQEVSGKTLLLISYRLGAMKYADRIVVMESGRIVEEGTHESLITRGGKYYEMYTAQAKWYQ